MMLLPICALLWLDISGALALQPVRDTFPAQHGVPEFSIRLGNDTASVCNSSTPGTSGFIDTGGDSHMFFWLFESKNDPLVDPVILWMTGFVFHLGGDCSLIVTVDPEPPQLGTVR